MDTMTKTKLPDTEPWDILRAEFYARGESAECAPTTVSTELPIEFYGEELSWWKRLTRRIVRRLVGHYLTALVTEQNRVNRSLREENALLRERVERLEESLRR